MKRFVMRILGIPEGQSPEFYRDVAVGIPMAFAAVVIVVASLDGDLWSWGCGAAVMVFVAGALVARNRVAVVGGALGFVGIRLLFALFRYLIQR